MTHFNGFLGAVDAIYMYGNTLLTPALLATLDTLDTLALALVPAASPPSPLASPRSLTRLLQPLVPWKT